MTSPDSPCPGEFTGQLVCLTLERYISNPSLSSNTTLELEPGIHTLENVLVAINKVSFEMISTNATVACTSDGRFRFEAIQNVLVRGITFSGCGEHACFSQNATFENSVFTSHQEQILEMRSNVTIVGCTFKNTQSNVQHIRTRGFGLTIINSTFSNIEQLQYSLIEVDCQFIKIIDSTFINITHIRSRVGLLEVYTSGVDILIYRSAFVNYISTGNGAIINSGGTSNIINITESTFINNTARDSSGGTIYSSTANLNMSIVRSSFQYNSAEYCGVLQVQGANNHVRITTSAFTYNTATENSNNAGGIICIRNASFLVLNSTFSHNSVIGGAGVMHVEESTATIQGSIFDNNTAGDDGGAISTYTYPTSYWIARSSFVNNQAGADGGVVNVERAGSQVRISDSIFGFNSAGDRGGVIAIVGSMLEINNSNSYNNTADLGGVISACNSEILVSSEEFEVFVTPDPIHQVCTLYDGYITHYNITPPTTIDLTVTDEGETISPTTDPACKCICEAITEAGTNAATQSEGGITTTTLSEEGTNTATQSEGGITTATQSDRGTTATQSEVGTSTATHSAGGITTATQSEAGTSTATQDEGGIYTTSTQGTNPTYPTQSESSTTSAAPGGSTTSSGEVTTTASSENIVRTATQSDLNKVILDRLELLSYITLGVTVLTCFMVVILCAVLLCLLCNNSSKQHHPPPRMNHPHQGEVESSPDNVRVNPGSNGE